MITELLTRLLFMSHEWGPALAIGSFDVKTAFDFMGHEVFFRALVARGVHGHIATGLVRELRNLQAEVEVPEVALASGIRVAGREDQRQRFFGTA